MLTKNIVLAAFVSVLFGACASMSTQSTVAGSDSLTTKVSFRVAGTVGSSGVQGVTLQRLSNGKGVVTNFANCPKKSDDGVDGTSDITWQVCQDSDYRLEIDAPSGEQGDYTALLTSSDKAAGLVREMTCSQAAGSLTCVDKPQSTQLAALPVGA